MIGEANLILGGGCTTSAIKSLISTRKSAFKVVPIPVVDKNEVPLVAKKRNAKNPPSKPTKVRKITKKVKKAIYDADDGEGDDGGDGDDNEDVGLVTPPFSGIKRESPRQAAFVKYECEDGGLDGILDEEKAGKVSSSSENGSDDGEFDPFA